MPKQAIYHPEAFKRMKSGVDKLAKAVVSTLGPTGKNVIIQGHGPDIVVTKDGVTVARFFDLEDPVEKLGAEIVKQAAYKVNKVGDGTTTTTLLAKEITDKLCTLEGDVHQIRKDIQKHCEDVCAFIDQTAIPCDSLSMLTKVATISANNDPEMGEIVGSLIWETGKDGVVTVEEWPGTDIVTERVEGFQIKNGYIAREMVTNVDKMECVLNDVAVLVTDKKLNSVGDVLPLMEKIATGFGGKIAPAKQLVVIADDVEGDALGTLVVNKFRAGFTSLAVRAPSLAYREESLKELAVMLGATLVSDSTAIKLASVKPEDLGRCKKVVSTKETTTFIGGAGSEEAVRGCIDEIDRELEDNKLTDFRREKLMERKARLAGGVAVIKVGAHTESELKERKFLVEDAVAACKAALDGGIVAGGGKALYEASKAIEGPLTGVLQSPARIIAQNANTAFQDVAGNGGLDAKAGKYVPDLIEAGIIDPAKVVKSTLENAVSVAAMLLTTDCVLYDEPEKKDK